MNLEKKRFMNFHFAYFFSHNNCSKKSTWLARGNSPFLARRGEGDFCGSGLVLPRSMRVRSLNSIAFHYVVGKRENQPRTEPGGGRGGGGIAMSLALCVSIQGLMGIEEEFCA